MQNSFLSSFTPSLMSSQDLEAIFVQREELVEDLIADVRASVRFNRESATTENKHYRLLIGMRGIGKTHTIALLYHRLRNDADLQDKLIIAWLKEEEWGVSSWLDLQIRIFQALGNSYPQKYQDKLATDVEALYNLSPEEATAKVEIILTEFINQRTLLILTENFDEILKGLGDKGQKEFKAYLQNNSFITMVATAQNLSNDLKSKKRAFYGFFEIDNLDKLSLDEATNLLTKIAQLQKDSELNKFIRSQTGRDRIKAIHYLAGGNHRVYIIFSQFLTRDSLDDLVKPVMQTLDELTPYYQARMQWLSLQQRKIVELLCDRRHAVPVKEIAQRCFISHQTASSQLKDLLNKGYVVKETQGRESFYELLEPLMRICLETKKQRGEPIKLFIDFLRIWYTKEELWQRYLSLPEAASIEREYLIKAMGISLSERELKIALVSFITKSFSQSSSEEINKLFTDVNNKDLDESFFSDLGNILNNAGKYEEAVKSLDYAIKMNPNNIDYWIQKAEILLETEQTNESLSVIEKIIELNPNDARSWNNKGTVLAKLKRYKDAVLAYEKAITLKPNDIEFWRNKGRSYVEVKEYEQAIKHFNKAIEIKSDDYLSLHDKSFALLELGRLQEALKSINHALTIKPDYIPSLIKKGMILHKQQNYDKALEAYKQAIDIDAQNVGVLLLLAQNMIEQEKIDDALQYCNYLINIEPNDAKYRLLKGVALFCLGNYKNSIDAFNEAISLDGNLTDAFVAKAESLFQLNFWDKGFQCIEDGLKTIDNSRNNYVDNTEKLIDSIYISKQDRKTWKDRIQTLTRLYLKYKYISSLTEGITRNIPNLLSEMISNKAARTWLEVWQQVAGDKPELEIALRFLKTAVEYKETKGDSKVLLQLPKEERDLFVTLLEEVEE